MRPKKDGPGARSKDAPSPARATRVPERAKWSPGAAATSKVNSGARSPGFRSKPKDSKERQTLIAQDLRRSSVIHRDENIGMELMDAPFRRTSSSRLEEEDFFEEMDRRYETGTLVPGISSASETPTFAQSPTEDEGTVRPGPAVSSGSRARPAGRPSPQTSIFSSDEETSPERMLRSFPKETPFLPRNVTRTSASFLSESEDSPTVLDARRFPKPQERLAGSLVRSAPVEKRVESLVQERSVRSEPLEKFPPEDLTLVIDNKAEKVTAQALEPAPAPAEASEDEAEASSPPPAAAPSESSGASEEEEEDLPQILIPEVLETAPKKPTERESPSRSRMASESQAKPSFGATPESPSKASRPKTVKLPVEPLPVASKAEGLVTPNWSGLEVRSPEAKPIRKEEVAVATPSTSTSTATPSGDPRFMSPSASVASEFRSPGNTQDQSKLKQQLEELEEQQKQIQSGLKEALNYHRRLWADELHRCRLASAELEKALEDERRQHAEQIEEWERRLQSELAKKETQWREEVDALIKEVERLRTRSELHRKPVKSSDDKDVASMMDSLSRELQVKPEAKSARGQTLAQDVRTKKGVEELEERSKVRAEKAGEAGTLSRAFSHDEKDAGSPSSLRPGAAKDCEAKQRERIVVEEEVVFTSPKVESPKNVRIDAKSDAPSEVPAHLRLPIGEPKSVKPALPKSVLVSSELECPKAEPCGRAQPVPHVESRSDTSHPSGPSRLQEVPINSAAFQAPRAVPMALHREVPGGGKIALPAPVLVPQDGTPSNSPLKRVLPKVQNFLDATPQGVPSQLLERQFPGDASPYGYSYSRSQMPVESPRWKPCLQSALGEANAASPSRALFPTPQAMTAEPLQATWSPRASSSPMKYKEAPRSLRPTFEPSLM